MTRPKCQKKAKNKTSLQHFISLHIAFPQIISLQKDTQVLKNTFPATQNDKAKNARKKRIEQFLRIIY